MRGQPESEQNQLERLELLSQQLSMAKERTRREPERAAFLDLAKVLIQIGDLKAGRKRHEEALEAFSDSVSACREALRLPGPTESDVRLHMVRGLDRVSTTLERLGRHDDALHFTHQSLAEVREFDRLTGHDEFSTRVLAAALTQYSRLLTDLERTEDALDVLREMEGVLRDAIARYPTNFGFQLSLTKCLHSIAEILSEQDKWEEALNLDMEARTLRLNLLEQGEPSQDLLYGTAISFERTADGHVNLNDDHHALEDYRKSTTLLRQWKAGLEREDLKGLSCLRLTLKKESEAAQRLEKFEEALEGFKEVIQLCRQLQSFRDDDEDIWEEALSWEKQAEAEGQLGRSDESFRSRKETVRAFRAYLARDPDAHDGLWGVAMSLFDLAEDAHELGLFSEAIGASEESIAIRRRIHSESEDPLESGHRLIMALDQHAWLCGSQALYESAKTSALESAALRERLLAEEGENVEGLLGLAWALDLAGDAQRSLGEDQEAMAMFHQALELADRAAEADGGSPETLGRAYLSRLKMHAATEGEYSRAEVLRSFKLYTDALDDPGRVQELRRDLMEESGFTEAELGPPPPTQ